MRNLRNFLVCEEVSDGATIEEYEHELYARIVSVQELLKASSKEHQSQWEIRVPKTELNAGKGSVRVRMTIPNVTDTDNIEYVINTKTSIENNPNIIGKLETPVKTTKENFDQFRAMCEIGMLKDRYFFPIPDTDLVWEIDMFYLPGAAVGAHQYHEWIKIDLEVRDMSAPLPQLPIQVTDLIINQKGKRTPEEEAKISALYEHEFITMNQLL